VKRYSMSTGLAWPANRVIPDSPPPEGKLPKQLGKLRERGLADPQDRLHQYDALLVVARALSDESTDEARVKDILERASARLGTVYGAAVPPLLGVTVESWGATPTERHQLAYDAFCAAQKARLLPGQAHCPMAFSSFTTRKEKEILNDLAVQLVKMVEEKLHHKTRRTT
jgi:hypothetical protein